MKKKRTKKLSSEDKEPSTSHLKEKNSSLPSQILNLSSLAAPNLAKKYVLAFPYESDITAPLNPFSITFERKQRQKHSNDTC